MTSTSARVLSESLDKLKVTETATSKTKSIPADSWEDEADDEPLPLKHSLHSSITPAESPEAPPTSPVSPSIRTKATSSGSPFQTFPPFGMNGSLEAEPGIAPTSTRSASSTDPDKRPEKTTSAAARLIAAGIGQRPPRRTQEERDYDQAMKVQEKKRRDAAKDEAARAEREKEKAKLAIWED